MKRDRKKSKQRSFNTKLCWKQAKIEISYSIHQGKILCLRSRVCLRFQFGEPLNCARSLLAAIAIRREVTAGKLVSKGFSLEIGRFCLTPGVGIQGTCGVSRHSGWKSVSLILKMVSFWETNFFSQNGCVFFDATKLHPQQIHAELGRSHRSGKIQHRFSRVKYKPRDAWRFLTRLPNRSAEEWRCFAFKFYQDFEQSEFEKRCVLTKWSAGFLSLLLLLLLLLLCRSQICCCMNRFKSRRFGVARFGASAMIKFAQCSTWVFPK